jgi:RNA polymerase sigma-70 factor (family 1)
MKEDLCLLLKRVADGDEKAFRSLFNQYSPKVFVFALKLTHNGSIAEEVVQEVFIKIWNSRRKLYEVEFFPSYISVITRNHCFNVLKRIALDERAKAVFSLEASFVNHETEDRVIYKDYQDILGRIVDQLPQQQKLVYGLCHGEGLKYEEAAERLNISRLTVKTHMQHALKTIKSRFGTLIQSSILIFLMPPL